MVIYQLNMVIFPWKMVIYPSKMVIYPSKMVIFQFAILVYQAGYPWVSFEFDRRQEAMAGPGDAEDGLMGWVFSMGIL